jgi:hypothetical protein
MSGVWESEHENSYRYGIEYSRPEFMTGKDFFKFLAYMLVILYKFAYRLYLFFDISTSERFSFRTSVSVLVVLQTCEVTRLQVFDNYNYLHGLCHWQWAESCIYR